MKTVLSVIFGILALVGIAAFFIIPGWYVGGAIFAGIVIVCTIITETKKKFETKCSKCKRPYNYEDDVEWRLIKRWTKGQPDTSNTLVRSYFLYDITCHCSACGTSKRYKKKIEGPSVNSKFEINGVDPEYVLEQNFDQSKEVTWGTVFAAFLMAVIFLVGGIGGGLFFSGKLGEMFNDVEIDIPGVTVAEKGEDPADYYGTYYYAQSCAVKKLEITDYSCVITTDDGRNTETEVLPYEYWSADYAANHIGSNDYPTHDVIIAFVDDAKTQGIVYYVNRDENGEYTFFTEMSDHATKDVITIADITNDPKDYYGTYRLDSYYITLNTDGTAKLNLGEGDEDYFYMYADGNYLKTCFNVMNYSSGIIFYHKGENSALVLNYVDGNLVLQDKYTFEK